MENSREDMPGSPEDDNSKQPAHPPLREEASTLRPPSSPATNNEKVQAYTDYSHLNPGDMKETDGTSSPSFPPSGGGTDQESSDGGRNSNNHKEPPFVAKLHSILSNSAFDDIVSWLPHGRAWRVHQRRAFEEQVIPLYFRHGKYSSFMRQVNGWGFQRINQGPDYGGYYHELFLRGMPHLATKIRRPIKPPPSPSRPAKRGRAKIDEDSLVVPPDFYKMAETRPLPTLPQSSDFPPLPRREEGRTDQESDGKVTAATAAPDSTATGGSGIGTHGAIISSQTTSTNSSERSAVGMGTNTFPMMPAGGGINPLYLAQSSNPAMAAVPSLSPEQLLMQALLAQQYQISQQSQIAQQLQLQNILTLLGGQAPYGSAGNQLNPAVAAPAEDPNLSHLSSALLELQSQAMKGNMGIPQPPTSQPGSTGDTTAEGKAYGEEQEEKGRRD